MSNSPRNLTRGQIAAIVGNDHRSVRAFEQMLKQLSDILPNELEAVKDLAESAGFDAAIGYSSANESLAAINRLSAAVELLATSQAESRQNKITCDSITISRNAPIGRPLDIAETQWNPTVGTIETRINDEIVLQHGQEVIRRMVNNTASTITAGQVVAFDSTSGDPETPNGRLFIANGTIPPFLVAGVATTTAAPGQIVYVTNYGVVHDINTSAFTGGGILYASPVIPGAMTQTKPSAPNVMVPIASVLSINATTGHVFVDPARFPRLYYGVFFDSTSQTIAAANTPQLVSINTTSIANGFSLGSPSSRVVAASSGLYNFQFSLQMVSSSSASITASIWARINGVDIPNSCTDITIKSDSDIIVPAWNFTQHMEANDYFELVIASSSNLLKLQSLPAQTTPYARPAVPSVILTVNQTNQ